MLSSPRTAVISRKPLCKHSSQILTDAATLTPGPPGSSFHTLTGVEVDRERLSAESFHRQDLSEHKQALTVTADRLANVGLSVVTIATVSLLHLYQSQY